MKNINKIDPSHIKHVKFSKNDILLPIMEFIEGCTKTTLLWMDISTEDNFKIPLKGATQEQRKLLLNYLMKNCSSFTIKMKKKKLKTKTTTP